MTFLVFNIFLFVAFTAAESQTNYRGGLLFEDAGAFAVNGDTLLYHRKANTEALSQASGQLADITLLYGSACRNVIRMAEPVDKIDKNTQPNVTRYVPTPVKYPITEAARACSMMGGRLPEARDEESIKQIQITAMQWEVDMILAGVDYDKKAGIFRYQSDKAPMDLTLFPVVEYGGTYTSLNHTTKDWRDEWITQFFDDWPLLYVYPGRSTFRIRIADANDRKRKEFIICEIPPDPVDQPTPRVSDNLLFRMAAHNCQRDMNAIIGMTAFTINEAEVLSNLKLNEKRKKIDFYDYLPRISKYNDNTTWFDTFTMDQKQSKMYIERDVLLRGNSRLKNYYSFLEAFNSKQRTQRSIDNVTDNVDHDSFLKATNKALWEIENVIDNTHMFLPKTHMYNVNAWQEKVKRDAEINRHTDVSAAVTSEMVDMGTTQAPLAFIGNIMEDLFGTVARRSQIRTIKQMLKMSKAIGDLSVNQQLMVKAINNYGTRLTFFQDQTMTLLEGTSVLLMINDLKAHVLHMQTLIQLTMSKYTHILMSASIGKTSPYALSVEEVKQIALTLPRSKWLREDLDQIITTITVENNTIHLIFKIPVLSDSDIYHFYRIIPLPIFENGSQLVPVIQHEHIAISKTGTRYIPVSADEFQFCLNNKFSCLAFTPSRPMNEQSACEIRTFATRLPKCTKYTTLTSKDWFMYRKESQIYYSVPAPLTLFVKCTDEMDSEVHNDTSVILEGMGEITFRPVCTITLPDGSSFKSQLVSEYENLSDLPIFNILEFKLDKPTITFEESKVYFAPIPKLTLANVEIPTWDEYLTEVFHPKSSLPTFTHIIIWTMICVMIGGSCYCCLPHFRPWLNKLRRWFRERNDVNAYEIKDSELTKYENQNMRYRGNVRPITEVERSIQDQHSVAENTHRLDALSQNLSNIRKFLCAAPPAPAVDPERVSIDSWLADARLSVKSEPETPPPIMFRVPK